MAESLEWEESFLNQARDFAEKEASWLNVAYYSERSVQDELARQSTATFSTVLTSYILMFVYISLSLGRWRRGFSAFLWKAKISVALFGVLLVLLSVAGATGLWSLMGGKVSLLVLEVLPFLVLAVAVDNFFLLVRALQSQSGEMRKQPSSERLKECLQQVAPSLLLACAAEVSCFSLGYIFGEMPAVRVFALLASIALVICLFLTLSCFVAMVALDVRREASRILDVFFCMKHKKNLEELEEEDGNNWKGLLDICVSAFSYWPTRSKIFRPALFTIFIGQLLYSLSTARHTTVGLDQRLAMPGDSYVLRFLDIQSSQLRVGPPFFIVADLTKVENFTLADPDAQNLVCGSAGCNQYSLVNLASQPHNYSATPLNSFLDDFFSWASDDSACCRLDTNGTFCPSLNRPPGAACAAKCKLGDIYNTAIRVKPDLFAQYLAYFLRDTPTPMCAQAGGAG